MFSQDRTALAACCEGKRGEDYVFTREDGKRVVDFRKTWRNACVAAGVPDLLVHDLRRTGARNLRRAGVSEGVIMKIGGWKTRSMFDRYNIVDQKDMRDAMVLLENSPRTAPVQPANGATPVAPKPDNPVRLN